MKQNTLVDSPKKMLIIDQSDNVYIALENIKKGEKCSLQGTDNPETIVAVHNIDFGHKLARYKIEKGEAVTKYGEVIGHATEEINHGEWIHAHNLHCERGFKN